MVSQSRDSATAKPRVDERSIILLRAMEHFRRTVVVHLWQRQVNLCHAGTM